MTPLITRLEEAAEGSRELDAAIWCAVHEPDADTHRAAAVDVVGLFDQISALCTSFNCQAHDADDVLGQINQLAYAGIAAVKPASVRTGQ